jgi:DNA-binding MarR family transcriptional regulator
MNQAVLQLPPSAKLAYKTLKHEGEATQAELAQRTGLPRRTLRYALNRLADEAGVVESEPRMTDARQSVYRLRDDSEDL